MLDRRSNFFDDDAPASAGDPSVATVDPPIVGHDVPAPAPMFSDDVETAEFATVDEALLSMPAPAQVQVQDDIPAIEQLAPAPAPAAPLEPRVTDGEEDPEDPFGMLLVNESRPRREKKAKPARERAVRPRPSMPRLSVPRPRLRLPQSALGRVVAGVAAALVLFIAAVSLVVVFSGAPAQPTPTKKAAPTGPDLSGAIFQHPDPPVIPARPYRSPEERMQAEVRKLRRELASARADRRKVRERLAAAEKRATKARRAAARRASTRAAARSTTTTTQTAPAAPVAPTVRQAPAPAARATPTFRPPSSSRPATSGRRSGGSGTGAEFSVEG
jgi:hypothetical protein